MRNTLTLAAALLLVGLLYAPEAAAQGRYRTPSNVVDASQPRDCTVKKGPGGLIRGDQIPSGCVIREDNGEPVLIYDGRNVYQVIRTEDGVLLPGNSIYHTPGPVNVILSDGTLAGITTAGPPQFGGQLAELPQGDGEFQPARGFGPIQRNFGSRSRNFGSRERNFGSRERNFGSRERNFGSRERNFGREPGSGLSGGDN